MKKILLASTVILSMAGISKTTVLAEENQATNKIEIVVFKTISKK